MKRIYKFELPPGVVNVSMPAGAHVLCVQVQRDTPCLWALCNPLAPSTTRRFFTYGTGHVMDGHTERDRYIGTYQLLGGQFVGHVFEKDAVSVQA